MLYSTNKDATRQGPTLKLKTDNPTTCNWGAVCSSWSPLIDPMFFGVGKFGSAPRTTMTGLDCTVRYSVYNLTSLEPVRTCRGPCNEKKKKKRPPPGSPVFTVRVPRVLGPCCRR